MLELSRRIVWDLVIATRFRLAGLANPLPLGKGLVAGSPFTGKQETGRAQTVCACTESSRQRQIRIIGAIRDVTD
jgi:hypothetical protein